MKSSNKYRLVTIGIVAKPKGVGFRLRVLPLTFDPARFLDLDSIFIEKEGTLHEKAIENVEIKGKYVFLKVDGIETMDECRNFVGSEVMINESDSPPLPEGEYYHYQIIGLEVFTDSGQYLGKVTDILETGSNDVYSVADGKREVLIPVIAEVIEKIDLNENRIIVHPIEGLLNDI
ncbi:MAG: ribosome maturation factor RimM [Thermodesulfovibrionales bacterium]